MQRPGWMFVLFTSLPACSGNDDAGGADASPAGAGGHQASGGGVEGGHEASGGGVSGGQGGGAETPQIDLGVTVDIGLPEPMCSGISGTYGVIRTRSATRPGSCPPDQEYNPSLPISIAADDTEASGYYVKLGYSSPDGEITFHKCVNNVAECSVFATCEPDGARDEVELAIDGNSLTGTLARAYTNANNCTINFDLEGDRQ